jgi:hypothetical protein
MVTMKVTAFPRSIRLSGGDGGDGREVATAVPVPKAEGEHRMRVVGQKFL